MSPKYILKKAAEDKHWAEIANAFIADKKPASRFEVARAVGISRERLNRLDKLGMLKGYPKPLNHSQASKIGRAKGNTWGKFRLRGSPTGGKQNATQMA